MKTALLAVFLLASRILAQTGGEGSATGLSDLPSAEAKPKLPGLDEAAPAPDLSGVAPPGTTSVPQPRPPAADPVQKKKTDDADWAVQSMVQKREEAKKKEQEQAALTEEKARESQKKLDQEKEDKATQASKQPTVAGPAASGFTSVEAQKLPAVTGLDGVKPRAMASGDGRVQPGFDAFTGPSSSSPMGGDFQSGAKPIMPGTTATDGRMQVPSKVPEAPSGAYKRISQDPYTLPAGYGEKKAAPPPPKPVVIPPNPSTGDPKRAIDDSKAGYSPYDNSKKVPDPRSQRRF